MVTANQSATLAQYSYTKGRSGNPAGRPKGSEGLAAHIKSKTNDCFKLADWMIAIAKDTGEAAMDRIAAIKWLADRSLGKVVEQVTDNDKLKLLSAMLSVPRVSMELKEEEKIIDATPSTNPHEIFVPEPSQTPPSPV